MVRRSLLSVAMLTVGSLGLLSAAALARHPPAADAEPGAVGIVGVPLGSVDPVAAPGRRLQVVELTWAPGAYTTRHFHPTALITCVASGSLGFRLDSGEATLIRGGTADAPGEPEPIAPGSEVALMPRDCIAFDEIASHMEHTGWNAADGETVLWEARLLDPEQPFTTYVNEEGTPVS